MKEYHRNHVIRPTELEKKERERRGKKDNKEGCKCLAPFVRLHYYDCPAVKKSCPVHGNHRYRAARDEKPEAEKNMIISFHPSSKTERLFQPVKTLLAQCAPETKVNLQYYSPKSTTSKESVKHQQIQTKSEDGKKALNNSIFVEKTKSFVADKTNKMKKLKQCFHSPCSSIAHKSRSQTSVREKFKEIFRDERKQLTPDKPPDDLKYESNLTWFSNKLDFKDWEKLSKDNVDSDFLTVTHQTKNNLINHKIFEIKHKKGLNDYPFLRLPEQPSQLVYSSLDMNRPMQKARTSSDQQDKRIFFENSPPNEGNERMRRGDSDLSSLENLHTSSSSSVYFTPFIFVPAAGDEVQMETKEHGDGKKESIAEETQTPSLQSEKDIVEDAKTKSVLLQTELDRHSGDSATPEWYLRHVEVAESFTTRGTQTDESLFRMDKGVGDSRRLSELSSEIFASPSRNEVYDFKAQGTQTSTSPTGSQGGSKSADMRTVQVQASRRRRPQGGMQNITTWTMTTMDKVVQTESCRTLEVRRLWSFKVNKSQMASPKLSNKTTQTIFSRSESLEEISEFIDLDSSNVTFVVKPFDNQESDQAIDKFSKAWWGKSHSDSRLYVSSKCSCFKPEPVVPSCSCNRSETPGKNTASYSSKEMSSYREMEPKRKADKSLGANDGSQKSYRRVDKGLGTDSGVETFGKADKALGTNSGITKMSKKVDKALGTENDLPELPKPAPKSQKAEKSPRKAECSCQAEETFLNEELPVPPVSDLSELTKIIQEFFEKMGKQPWRTCPCENSGVPERKTEKMATPRKAKKESVDHHTMTQKPPDSEATTEAPKKPRREYVNEETQVDSSTKGVLMTDRSGSRPPTERVKIRRSVLLDDNEPRTRFVCSVCAREISTYSTNAATNTDNMQSSPRKKENSHTVSTEISELVKVKSVRTFQSYDDPKRLTSAPEPTVRVQTSDAKEGTSPIMYKGSGTPKSYSATPKPVPTVTISDRAPQIIKTDTVRQDIVRQDIVRQDSVRQDSVRQDNVRQDIVRQDNVRQDIIRQDNIRQDTVRQDTVRQDNVRQDTVRQDTVRQDNVRQDTIKPTATITISKPIRCICEHEVNVCTKDSCPNREVNQNMPTTSRGVQPRTEHYSSTSRPDHPGAPSSGSKRPTDKGRTQRRTLEPYYPVFVKSPWPRDLTWNMRRGSYSSVPEEWESSTTLQQKRSYSRESDATDTPAGKKIKPELDKPLGQYFVLGRATSQDLRMGDHIVLPNKGGFILIPSLSASSVDSPRKHSQSKKSKDKVLEPNELQEVAPQEGLNDPPDLSSTTSCRVTPQRLECDDDKLLECRLCKSLTLMKTDRESVVFHWRHGLLTYRPTVAQNPTATRARRDDSESLHPNESSTQNLDVLFEESSPSTDRSDSPSPYELLPEEGGETSEEERNSRLRKRGLNRRSNGTALTLSDIFYSNAAVSSKSFNEFWSEGYHKKESKPDI